MRGWAGPSPEGWAARPWWAVAGGVRSPARRVGATAADPNTFSVTYRTARGKGVVVGAVPGCQGWRVRAVVVVSPAGPRRTRVLLVMSAWLVWVSQSAMGMFSQVMRVVGLAVAVNVPSVWTPQVPVRWLQPSEPVQCPSGVNSTNARPAVVSSAGVQWPIRACCRGCAEGAPVGIGSVVGAVGSVGVVSAAGVAGRGPTAWGPSVSVVVVSGRGTWTPAVGCGGWCCPGSQTS
ncbi:hypothetical protein Ae717Ps2_5788c [Pseudonocardia sp. Ae717_Ps2]|nr:hypothetical protein Ae717Ps2_5788c [Pseudonocardia sp. Ae717_Ps2]